MNINIGYSVILAFDIFHLRGQTNVAYLEHPFSNKLYFDINSSNQTILSVYKYIYISFLLDVKQMWYIFV